MVSTTFRNTNEVCDISVNNIAYIIDGETVSDEKTIESLGLETYAYDSTIENALEKIDGELRYFADKVKQYLENIFEETVKSFDININDDTYHYDGTDIEALNHIRTND